MWPHWIKTACLPWHWTAPLKSAYRIIALTMHGKSVINPASEANQSQQTHLFNHSPLTISLRVPRNKEVMLFKLELTCSVYMWTPWRVRFTSAYMGLLVISVVSGSVNEIRKFLDVYLLFILLIMLLLCKECVFTINCQVIVSKQNNCPLNLKLLIYSGTSQ